MTLYVRADVASVNGVPGGCGQPHSRPVVSGAPVHVTPEGKLAPWPLTCPQCEPSLAEDIRRSGGKKIRTVNDEHGMPMAERYLGLFGGTEDTVPESPDDEVHRQAMERKTATDQAAKTVNLAEQSAASLNSIAAAIASNSELMGQLVKMGFMSGSGPVIRGEVIPETPGAPEIPGMKQEYTYTCQACGNDFLRASNKGPAPKRCPDCKAAA